jgi:acyl dehydratase
MALNASLVGRSYPAQRSYEVCREKLREFADAIGDGSPVYRDPEAARSTGLPDVVAPPTFLFSVTMPWTAQLIGDPELGADYSRLVHGEQSFHSTRPVVPGDVLSGGVTIEAILVRGRNEYLVYRTDVTDASGEAVATLRSTVVFRGTAPPEEG